MFQIPNIVPSVSNIIGLNHSKGKGKIKGTVVLMKKYVLDFSCFAFSALDRLSEFVGQGVTLQLISAVHADPGNRNKGKVGKPANLESRITTLKSLTAGQSAFKVQFDWEEDVGIPGAVLIRNNRLSELYLVSLTLEDISSHGSTHFDTATHDGFTQLPNTTKIASSLSTT